MGRDSLCEGAVYGCCPDGYTAADGPNFGGCPGVAIYPGDSGCENTLYGCCPDGIVAALGPEGDGCENIIFDDCDLTVYGKLIKSENRYFLINVTQYNAKYVSFVTFLCTTMSIDISLVIISSSFMNTTHSMGKSITYILYY